MERSSCRLYMEASEQHRLMRLVAVSPRKGLEYWRTSARSYQRGKATRKLKRARNYELATLEDDA